MGLLDPEVLEAGRALSPAIAGAGIVIGSFLWLVGAWTHRFWIVLTLTLAAGVYGLIYGPEHGLQPIIAGLLLAVAAGTLGLALMRVLAFVTGGWALYLAARAVAPGMDEPLLCFLVGGLFSVVLFRFWITSVSSMAGTLAIAYSSLWLIDKLGKVNTVAWAVHNAPLWNWGLASFAVLGILVQFVLHRRYLRKKKEDEEQAKAEDQARQEEEERRRRPPLPPRKKSWWPFSSKGQSARAA